MLEFKYTRDLHIQISYMYVFIVTCPFMINMVCVWFANLVLVKPRSYMVNSDRSPVLSCTSMLLDMRTKWERGIWITRIHRVKHLKTRITDGVKTVILTLKSLKMHRSPSYVIQFVKEFLTYILLTYPFIHTSSYACMYSYLLTRWINIH